MAIPPLPPSKADNYIYVRERLAFFLAELGVGPAVSGLLSIL